MWHHNGSLSFLAAYSSCSLNGSKTICSQHVLFISSISCIFSDSSNYLEFRRWMRCHEKGSSSVIIYCASANQTELVCELFVLNATASALDVFFFFCVCKLSYICWFYSMLQLSTILGQRYVTLSRWYPKQNAINLLIGIFLCLGCYPRVNFSKQDLTYGQTSWISVPSSRKRPPAGASSAGVRDG